MLIAALTPTGGYKYCPPYINVKTNDSGGVTITVRGERPDGSSGDDTVATFSKTDFMAFLEEAARGITEGDDADRLRRLRCGMGSLTPPDEALRRPRCEYPDCDWAVPSVNTPCQRQASIAPQRKSKAVTTDEIVAARVTKYTLSLLQHHAPSQPDGVCRCDDCGVCRHILTELRYIQMAARETAPVPNVRQEQKQDS